MRTVALLTLVAILAGVTGCQKKPRASTSGGGSSSSMSSDPAMTGYGSSGAESAPAGNTPQPVPLLPEPATAGGAGSGEMSSGATAAHASSGGSYVVKKGDTLTSISRQVYGSPARVRDILAANPGLKDPNRIKVGQKLNLP